MCDSTLGMTCGLSIGVHRKESGTVSIPVKLPNELTDMEDMEIVKSFARARAEFVYWRAVMESSKRLHEFAAAQEQADAADINTVLQDKDFNNPL